MKREQKVLVTAVATLLGSALSVPQAIAAFDLTGANTAPTVVSYASELSGTLTLSSLDVININLGPGIATDATVVPGGATAYVRIDVTNAQFAQGAGPALAGVAAGTPAASANVADTDCPTGSVPTATLAPSQAGGAVSTGTWIFGVTNSLPAGGASFVAGCTLAINLAAGGGLYVMDASQPITFSYSLYSAPLAAINKQGAIASRSNVPLTAVTSAVSLIKSSTSQNATASVEENFNYFKKGESNSGASGATGIPTGKYDRASFGVFQFKSTGAKGKNGSVVTLADLYDTASKLSITGDFSSIYATGGTGASVFLSNNASCTSMLDAANSGGKGAWGPTTTTTSGTTTSTLAPSSVSFTMTTPLIADIMGTGVGATMATDGIVYACAQLGTTVASLNATDNPANFSLKLDAVGGTNTTIGPFAKATGTKVVELSGIVRDGAVLESPFFSISPGFTSRMILAHLNPKATNDAKFFITLRSDDSKHLQKIKEGTLKKGTILELFGSDIFSMDTGAMRQRVGITVNLFSLNDEVQGVIQHINQTTGEVTNLPMLRPGGGSGKK